jgi:hypothetical protein
MVISLEEIIALDPTVKNVAMLPLGWSAWRDTPHKMPVLAKDKPAVTGQNWPGKWQT